MLAVAVVPQEIGQPLPCRGHPGTSGEIGNDRRAFPAGQLNWLTLDILDAETPKEKQLQAYLGTVTGHYVPRFPILT